MGVGLQPWSLTRTAPELWANPWAEHPLVEDWSFAVHAALETGEIVSEKKDPTLAALFDLSRAGPRAGPFRETESFADAGCCERTYAWSWIKLDPSSQAEGAGSTPVIRFFTLLWSQNLESGSRPVPDWLYSSNHRAGFSLAARKLSLRVDGWV